MGKDRESRYRTDLGLQKREVVAALWGVSSNEGVGVKSFIPTYESHDGKVACSTLKAYTSLNNL